MEKNRYLGQVFQDLKVEIRYIQVIKRIVGTQNNKLLGLGW